MMPHWRRQYSPPDRLQIVVHGTVDTVGFITYLLVLVGIIVLIFASTPKARAATCQPGQIEGLAELARDLKVKPTTEQGLVAQGCDGKTYDVVSLIRAHVEMMRKVKK